MSNNTNDFNFGFGDLFSFLEMDEDESLKTEAKDKRGETETKIFEKKVSADSNASVGELNDSESAAAETNAATTYSGLIKVISPFYTEDIDCGDGITEKQLITQLATIHYELNSKYYHLVPDSEKKVVLVCVSAAKPDESKKELPSSAQVFLGNTAYAASGMPLGNVTIRDAKQYIGDLVPELKKCEYVYDSKYDLLIPIPPQKVQEKDITLPCEVYTQDGPIEVSGSGRITISDFMDQKYLQPIITSDFAHVEFAATSSEHSVMLHFLYKKETAGKSSGSSSSKSDATESGLSDPKKIKIPLPVNIAYAFRADQETLSPGLFGGKETVTLQDIIDLVSASYATFRLGKPNFYYIKEENVVVASILTQRKGAICNLAYNMTDAMWQAEKQEGMYLFNTPTGSTGKVISTTSGIFTLKDGFLDFQYRLPKIPVPVWNKLIETFQACAPLEDAMRIYYNIREQQFVAVRPKIVTASKTHVDYQDLLLPYDASTDWAYVLDVHSHGHFPAFFSARDCQSCYYPMLYLVIGSFQCSEQTFALKAAAEGLFTNIALSDIFDFMEEN